MREAPTSQSRGRWHEFGATPPAEYDQYKSALRGQEAAQQRLAASQALTAEALAGKGKPIFGYGARTPLENADRLAAQYGGAPSDWAKMRSGSSSTLGTSMPNGRAFEVHWYQNMRTRAVVEIKTKITGH